MVPRKVQLIEGTGKKRQAIHPVGPIIWEESQERGGLNWPLEGLVFSP